MTVDQTAIVEATKTAAELEEERRLNYERDLEVRAACLLRCARALVLATYA